MALRVAVIGAGGVGGYFGGKLALAGTDVTFVARGAHLAAMREHGLRVLSGNGDFTVSPVRATDDPAAVGPVDLAIIAVKLWSTDEAVATARALAGPDTAVMSLQNGVIAVDTLVSAFGRERVIGGVANIAALIEAPGVVRHNGTMAMLQFGELDGSRSPRVEALAAACASAGFDHRNPDDIRKAIWEKFALLAPFSGLTTLARLPAGPLRADADTRALFRQLVEEVVAVGRARGNAVGEDTVTAIMNRLDSLPPAMVASMLGDLLRGNRLELPWLSGGVVQLGEASGVPTPAHRFVYTALKLYADGRPAEAR